MKKILKLGIYTFFIALSVFYPESVSDFSVQFLWVIDKKTAHTVYYFKDFFTVENQTNYYTHQHKLVYYNNNGEKLFSASYPSDLKITAGISQFRYVRYFKYGHSIGVYEKGRKLGFFHTDSYPVISKDGRFVCLITGEGEGFHILNVADFSVSAPVRMGYPLIDVQRGQSDFYIGLLNGYFIKIASDSTNHLYSVVNNQDSAVNIVKRIAVSKEERYIAYLSGLYPEYLKVFDNQKNKNVYQTRTGENQRKKTFLVFSDKGRYIASETKTGFQIFRLYKKKPVLLFSSSELGEKKFASFAFLSDHLFLFSFTVENHAVIYILNKDGIIVYKKDFSDRWLAVRAVSSGECILESPDKIYSLYIEQGGYYE